MPPLLFPLPTTSLLTFSALLLDPNNAYGSALAEATSARTRLQIALKAVADDQPGSSALAVVDAVQGYLPYLSGISACLDADLLLFRSDPLFPWRAPLTAYTASPPLLPLPSIHAEQLMVLLTYALSLSNYAHAILASLPTSSALMAAGSGSRFVAPLSAEDEKKTAAGLSRVVDLLCQASGVAVWAAENVCPKLDGPKKAAGRLGKSKWPVETGDDAFRGLSMMMLADAHVIAIRKLQLPTFSYVLFSPPGPPLPPNHPSPSLLAKLHLHVASLYSSAQALCKIGSAEGPSRKLFGKDKDRENVEDNVDGDVIPALKRYLRKESFLSAALARKWLGVDAGENGRGAKIGEALAWVKLARESLEELEDGVVREKIKGLSFGKASERRKDERLARKGRLERELEDVAAWIKSYQQQNDTVAFQPVPPASSLTLPAGRPIFSAKAFTPPESKMELFRRDDVEDGDDQRPQDGSSPSTKAISNEAYAGRGNYF